MLTRPAAELTAADLRHLAAVLDYGRPERPGNKIAALLKPAIDAGRGRVLEILDAAEAEDWLEMERRRR